MGLSIRKEEDGIKTKGDNGEVLIKFVCITNFDDFIPFVGTQIQ